MTDQELETLFQDLAEMNTVNKSKYLEFNMNFDVVSVEVVMSLN